MKGQDAHRIAADAEEHRVAEADQPAKPQRDVQPDRGQRKDRRARGQRDGEGLVRDMRPERHRRAAPRGHRIDSAFAHHARAPNRPVGRQISTAPIRM